MLKLFLLLILIIVIVFSVYLYKKLISYSQKKNFKTIIIFTLFTIIGSISMLFYFIINGEKNIDKQYFAPSYDGEKLIPGFFSDEKKKD